MEPPVDFIKVDVEGYELEVVKGAQRLIRSCRPTLFVEVHPAIIACQDRVGELIDLLSTTHPRVECLVPDRHGGVVRSIIGRYFSSFAIRRLPWAEEVRPGLTVLQEATFWLLATAGGDNRRSVAV